MIAPSSVLKVQAWLIVTRIHEFLALRVVCGNAVALNIRA